MRSRVVSLRGGRRPRPVATTAVALVGAQVMMAVAGVLAARALGPAGRGVVTAVLTWPMMLAHLSLVGMNSSATIRIARGHREGVATTLGSALAYSAVVGVVVAAGAVAVVPAALSDLGSDASTLTMIALATIPLILLADILMSVNVALGRIVRANRCRLIAPAIILIGTTLLILADHVTPAWIVAVNLLAGMPALAIAAAGLPWRRMALRMPALLADLKFGAKAHLGSILGIANFRLDVLLMSAFVPASQLGYYGVANSMMLPVMTVAQAAAILLTPRVAAMARSDDGIDAAQLASIRSDGRRFVLLGVAGAVLVAIVAPFAVPLLFGDAFRPVVVLVWILLPGFIARNYAVLVCAGALGGRRPWVGNAVEGAGVVITITLLPLLLPRYEAVGAATTSTVAYGVSALVALLAIRHFARRNDAQAAVDREDAESGIEHSTSALAVRAG